MGTTTTAAEVSAQCTDVRPWGWVDGATTSSITRTCRARRRRATLHRCRSGGVQQRSDERRRVGLARSRRHGGVVGWVDGASAESITRAWRISRRLTTWVGPDGWEEGDVSVGLRRPRGYLHCAGRGAPTVHYGTPNRGGLDGHHHGAVVGTVDDFHRVLETTATPTACRVSSLVLDSAARVGGERRRPRSRMGVGGVERRVPRVELCRICRREGGGATILRSNSRRVGRERVFAASWAEGQASRR